MRTKKDIRDAMRRRRDALTSAEVKQRSAAIMSNLNTVPDFFRADVVHTYISSKNNEVDTHQLIRWLLKEGKRVVVPVADPATKLLRHAEIFSLAELVVGPYGIYQPAAVRPVKAESIDVVVVPALAVDREGHRVGFGGGFYDRFLHDLSVPSIVPVYDFQVIDAVPREIHDRRVSFIVTDHEIIRC